MVPPMVTPLSGRDTLDIPGLERLVEHLLDGGVQGLFLLGTTGEGPSLSYRLRRELIERTCRLVHSRIPVLVCVTDTSIEESLAVARHAAASGAEAVVASTPYYFPASQPELLSYFETLASELPLPLYLYNMPAMTKTVVEPETVSRLMQHPNIVGIKDSSGDLAYFDHLLTIAREREDWSVFMGPEELTSRVVQRGAHGGVNGGANLLPRLYVENYEAAAAGDTERAERLSSQVLSVAGKIYTVGRHGSSLIKGLKCALSLLGICSDEVAPPFYRFDNAERDIIRERLVELGLLPA
jgi:4-hydroxy-tetrahydrodipicolinate synthase